MHSVSRGLGAEAHYSHLRSRRPRGWSLGHVVLVLLLLLPFLKDACGLGGLALLEALLELLRDVLELARDLAEVLGHARELVRA